MTSTFIRTTRTDEGKCLCCGSVGTGGCCDQCCNNDSGQAAGSCTVVITGSSCSYLNGSFTCTKINPISSCQTDYISDYVYSTDNLPTCDFSGFPANSRRVRAGFSCGSSFCFGTSGACCDFARANITCEIGNTDLDEWQSFIPPTGIDSNSGSWSSFSCDGTGGTWTGTFDVTQQARFDGSCKCCPSLGTGVIGSANIAVTQ